jgi:hypothetical protein
MFDALVFAVYDCGFIARCTKELSDASQARIENILTLISECKYGIHDISRTEPSEGSGLPRFNMPLELGLFLGAARFGRREKRCLVLDREQYRYQQYISDIAGQDIEPHDDDDPKMAIRKVRDWLRTVAVPHGVSLPGGTRMTERYDAFTEQLPTQCARAHLTPEELTFSDFSALVSGWLLENPW